MNSQLPIAVRTIAAALAVFMTVATLNGMLSFAEPQHSQLIAVTAARQAERMALAAQRGAVVAEAASGSTRR